MLAFASAASNSGDVFAQETNNWVTSFYSITLSCNLIATAILAYRLWSVDRNAARSRVGRSSITLPVLLVVIDAGAIYSLTLIAAIVCFALKSTFLVVDMITPIISIAFYMVILRVGLGAQRDLVVMHDDSAGSRFPRVPIRTRGAPPDRFKGPVHMHFRAGQTSGEYDPQKGHAV